MQLSLHCDYAFRTLLYLASRPGQSVPVAEVSLAYGISHHHLLKVVGELGKRGYIVATRGKSGGIRLERDPQTIRLGDVTLDLEPNFDLVECFAPDKDTCPITPACQLQFYLRDALRRFIDTLNQYTLADCVREPRPLVQILGRSLARAAEEGPPPRSARGRSP